MEVSKYYPSPLFLIMFIYTRRRLVKRKETSTLIAESKDCVFRGEIAAKKQELKSEGPSLVFFKEAPITFQLSRSENPKDFELMDFVTKVCLKTADQLYKTVLHVEQIRKSSRLIASDGLRLHIAYISKKIKSGDYYPNKTKDTISLGEPMEGIDFPVWSKAIPVNAKKRGVIDLKKSGLGKNQEETDCLSVALFTFIKQTGQTINLRFLDDLLKREWTVFSENERGVAIILKQNPVKIDEAKEKSPMAIIMPIDVPA